MSAAWRRGLLVPGIAVVLGLAIFVSLGVWQLQRKAWKEALIATIAERAAASPADLPPPDTWARLSPEADEFRHVRFKADFAADRSVSVYVAGSALRDDIKGPGYFVFRPGRLADGKTVVVDRGYVPQGTFVDSQAESVEIVGYLRWPEKRPWFFPDQDAASDLWLVRDHIGMAAARAGGWGEVAPFYVAQELPVPQGGWPKPGPITLQLRNEHLQYAVTWFGLAGVVAVAFLFWVRSRRAAPDAL